MKSAVSTTRDIDFVNSMMNAEGVGEWHVPPELRGQEIDYTPLIEMGSFGVRHNDTHLWLYQPLGAGVYEVHTSVLPEARGKDTIPLSRQSVDHVFTHTDAVEIWTRVPEGNEPAYKLAQACGFKNRFTAHGKWGGKDVRVMSLPIQVWAARATSFREYGEYFHWVLEQTGTGPSHDKDKIHDQYVGITVAMMLANQPTKAVWFYNQWAYVAFYHPITLESIDPIVINAKTHIVTVKDGDITAEVR